MSGEVTRTLVVHVADWPLVAAGVPASEPAVVVRANRVVAASVAARAEGEAPGLRRRQNAVSTNDFPGLTVAHQQVLAEIIKYVDVMLRNG